MIFDQLQNILVYIINKENLYKIYNVGDKFDNTKQVIEIIPATGLQIKYDPSIPIIYTGFGLINGYSLFKLFTLYSNLAL